MLSDLILNKLISLLFRIHSVQKSVPGGLHGLIQLLLNKINTYTVTIYTKGNRKKNGKLT